MATPVIEKVHMGCRVDSIDLLQKNCGCGSLTGPGGYGVGDCCMTYSTVKNEGNVYYFVAKGTTPNTVMNIEYGCRVKKGDVEVDVHVYDTKSPKTFKNMAALPLRTCQIGRERAGRWSPGLSGT